MIDRTRFEDWPLRLSVFLRAREIMGFEWGVNDCALFAADWVLECTGVDPAAWYRGRYNTEIGAGRALIEAGFSGGLADAVTAVLGPGSDKVLMAQRGDVAIMPNDGSPALGVVTGATVALLCIDGGIVHKPLRSAIKFWKV